MEQGKNCAKKTKHLQFALPFLHEAVNSKDMNIYKINIDISYKNSASGSIDIALKGVVQLQVSKNMA